MSNETDKLLHELTSLMKDQVWTYVKYQQLA